MDDAFTSEPATAELTLTAEDLEAHTQFMALGRTRTTQRDLAVKAAACHEPERITCTCCGLSQPFSALRNVRPWPGTGIEIGECVCNSTLARECEAA